MKLAILVMKYPPSCGSCDIEHMEENYYGDVLSHDCPFIYKGYTDSFRLMKRHPECPLREFPGLRIVNPELDKKRKLFFEQYVNGWNDCVAEILGNMGEKECMADVENVEGSSSTPSAGSGDSGQTAGQK
ncbi:MAG: hypothetical protein IJV14_16605 [Lachnospiraceae bacterium]|nr:hypothetical protein [Lachnospiraceae bacterium]